MGGKAGRTNSTSEQGFPRTNERWKASLPIQFSSQVPVMCLVLSSMTGKNYRGRASSEQFLVTRMYQSPCSKVSVESTGNTEH